MKECKLCGRTYRPRKYGVKYNVCPSCKQEIIENREGGKYLHLLEKNGVIADGLERISNDKSKEINS